MTENGESALPAGGVGTGEAQAIAFADYLPGYLRQGLSFAKSREYPIVESLEIAVACIDIVGFSTITERLSRSAETGAEAVQALINDCFGTLTELVAQDGGDILHFAGDAVIAFWRVVNGDLSDAALSAVRCAGAAQAALDRMQSGHALEVRAGVGAGTALAAIVGGTQGRRELVLGGTPLTEITITLEAARPREVIASTTVVGLLEGRGLRWTRQERVYRLEDPGQRGPESRQGDAAEAVSGSPAKTPPALRQAEQRATVDYLRSFVPRAVLARLDAGQADWLAEFRQASVMFVAIRGLSFDDDAWAQRLQSAVVALQGVIYHSEGSVNQLLVDDKGTVLLAGWGLALHSHEDDPVRAVRAGLTSHRELARLGIDSAVGIATGRVFTGRRGGTGRTEFALIGATVNLAARLMQQAGDAGPVLCDTQTRDSARSDFEFESLGEVPVKGRSEPLLVHRPTGDRPTGSGRRPRQRPLALIDREAQRELLERALGELEEFPGGAGWAIVGEPGIGKSSLVAWLLEKTDSRPIESFLGRADALSRSDPFHAWRDIIGPLLYDSSRSQPPDVSALLERVDGLCVESELPLLNPFLPLRIPDSELVRKMTARARSARRQEIVLGLLQRRSASSALLLVFEDAHWLDSASWGLIEAVSASRERVLLVVTSRPLTDDTTGAKVLGGAQFRQIDLGPLPPDDMTALVCQRLDVEELPTRVSTELVERSQGNPLYAEELALAMRDSGSIVVAGGRCRVDSRVRDLGRVSTSGTVQGAVASRIDQLGPEMQLTLRTASVLGRSFTVAALGAIHPTIRDHQRLGAEIEKMIELDLLGSQRHTASSAGSPSVEFTHKTIQEVAYELLPFEHRFELHQRFARWLEQKSPSDPSRRASLLAHHWRAGREPEKALGYYRDAVSEAVGNGHNEEVIRLAAQAIELITQRGEPAGSSDELGFWRLRRGRAMIVLGQYDAGQAELRLALERLGCALPQSEMGHRVALTGALLTQTRRRLLPPRLTPAERERPALAAVSEAHLALTGLSYHSGGGTSRLHSAVAAVNYAERAGPSAELAIAYANLCLTSGAIRLHRLARRYAELARSVAEQVDQPATSAIALTRTAIYGLAVGDWRQLADIERAAAVAERYNERRECEEATFISALALIHLGRYQESEQFAAQVLASARKGRAMLPQIWAYRALCEAQARMGRQDEAIASCDRGLELIERHDNRLIRVAIQLQNVKAFCLLERGEHEAAIECAVDAWRSVGRAGFVGYDHFSWLNGIGEVFLEGWERGHSSDGTPSLKALAGKCCQLLGKADPQFPVTYCRALRDRGWQSALEGREDRARRLWQRGLALAERFELPYEAGLLHWELARWDAGGDRRQGHLENAAALFERIGAAWQSQRVRGALADHPRS